MKLKVFVATALMTTSVAGFATTSITGAGSTFVYPVLSLWAADYAKKTGIEINYQAIGSGGGIAQIEAGTVDFGASDKPLSDADLQKHHLTQFPIIHGEIVLVENVKTTQPITLTGTAIASIYLGQVKYWDDPSLEKLNPGVKLPHQVITVLYRADGSGTTYNFTKYLSSISPAFKSIVGSDTVVPWPADLNGMGAKGNAGVASFVKMIPGSIGYVEYAYAQQNHLTTAKTPTLMATTYALLPDQGKNNAAVNAFMQYCFAHPERAISLNYVPVQS